MPTLPSTMIAVLRAFAPLFSPRVWAYVPVLLVGAILAPVQRTVTAAPRVPRQDGWPDQSGPGGTRPAARTRIWSAANGSSNRVVWR